MGENAENDPFISERLALLAEFGFLLPRNGWFFLTESSLGFPSLLLASLLLGDLGVRRLPLPSLYLLISKMQTEALTSVPTCQASGEDRKCGQSWSFHAYANTGMASACYQFPLLPEAGEIPHRKSPDSCGVVEKALPP